MKVLALSDLHGYLPTIPPCDLLLLAGDYEWSRNVYEQMHWMSTTFLPWLDALPAQDIVWIAGNHDQTLYLQTSGRAAWEHRAHYLQDSAVTIEGLKIYGTPWTPPFFNWWFMREEPELRTTFAAIPEDTDVLIAHGPPRLCCDNNADGIRCGSEALAERVRVIQPKALICGHIHEGRGTGTIGRTKVYNVTLVDLRYIPKYAPMEIEL